MLRIRLSLLVLLTLLALFFVAPLVLSTAPLHPHLEDSLQGPSSTHWLGTDANGRDILWQILWGGKASLVVSLCVVSLCLGAGLLFGSIAGYFGGYWDRSILAVADIIQAFPGILLAIFLAAFLPQRLMNLVLLLSAVGWVGYARVIRSQVIELKSREFITAGRALGLPWYTLLLRHFLPNMLGPIVVQASFGMAGVIMAESTLSFLGLGLPEGIPSLGKLMDSGVSLLLVAPHVALFPGLVIMLLVLLFQILGESLRSFWSRA